MGKTIYLVTTLSSSSVMANINITRLYCDQLQIMNSFCLSCKQDLSDRNTPFSTRISTGIPQFSLSDPSQIIHLFHDLSKYCLLQDTTGDVDLDFNSRRTSKNSYFAREISQLYAGGKSVQNDLAFGTRFMVKLCQSCKEE